MQNLRERSGLHFDGLNFRSLLNFCKILKNERNTTNFENQIPSVALSTLRVPADNSS